MAEWYYARDGQQLGPISESQLRAELAAGRLRPDELVWRDGLSAWTPAGSLEELKPTVTADLPLGGAPAVAAPAPTGNVSYYTHRGLPPRMANSLSGFGAPTGDIGVWPLDDASVAEWETACAYRKPIRRAVALYGLLAALNASIGIILVVAVLVAPSNRTRSPIVHVLAIGMILAFFFGIGAVLGGMAYVTRRNHAWAAIVMSVLFGAGLVAQIVGVCIYAIRTSAGAGVLITLQLIGAAASTVFLIISLRAVPAIRRFRTSPAWVQELAAIAKC